MGRAAVRITADTNVLLRAVLNDDPHQARIAADALSGAEIVAVPLPVLCEYVWVLLRSYGRNAAEIAASIRDLTDSANVRLDRPAVEAGLAALEAGGDFADGVIAFEGHRLGGPIFVSFDRDAVDLIAASGAEIRLLPTR